MIDLGRVRPLQTIEFTFGTFDGGTGASITATDYVAGDVKIFKNGSATARTGTSGITLYGPDFSSLTGVHGLSIDLSDNSDAGFYSAGARYFVAIGPITVDAQTVNFPVGSFRIGMEGAILDTTITSLSSQTVFQLSAGPTELGALIGCPVVISDVATAGQVATAIISAYAVTTRQVTLTTAPTFTIANTDNISIFPPANMRWIAAAVPATGTAHFGVNAVQAGGTVWGSGAITNGSIASSAISSAKFGASAITSTVLAANAIAAGNIATGAITAAKFAAGAIDAAAIAANAIGASELATDAVNEIRDAILSDSIAFAGAAITEARLAELDAANLPAVTDGIKAKTDSLAFTVANQVDANVLGIEGLDPTDQINAAADTALTDYDPPTKAELDAIWTTGHAHIWYVATTGNDGNAGHTRGGALLTIGAAITAAEDGDIIKVGTGTFDAALTVNKALTIEGVGPDETIISNSADATVVTATVGGVTLRNLRVTKSGTTAGACIDKGSVNFFTLEDVYLFGLAANGTGLIGGNASGLFLTRVRMAVTGHCLDLTSATNIQIRDSVFLTTCQDSNETEVYCFNANGGTGITVTRSIFDIGNTDASSDHQVSARIGGTADVFFRDCAFFSDRFGGSGDNKGLETLAATVEVLLENCRFTSRGGFGTQRDIVVFADSKVSVHNTVYDTATTTGTIILGGTAITDTHDDWQDAGRLDALIDAIKAKTDSLTFTVANQVDANALGIEGSDPTDQINAAVDAAFTTQMADSVAADGVIATREQALYMMLQFLTERAYSGTTVTVKKVDGSTSLYALTLDDGADPTSVTRS
jgi:hypothetical protein